MAYIDKDLLLKDIKESVVFSVRTGYISPELRGARKIIDRIENAPTADVVLTEVMEQIKWERDIAIEQLASYGVCLGEKKELTEVVRCEKCKDFEPHGNGKAGICRNRKLKPCLRHDTDFCSYGTPKERGGEK